MAKRRMLLKSKQDAKPFTPKSGPQENKGFDNDGESEEQDKNRLPLAKISTTAKNKVLEAIHSSNQRNRECYVRSVSQEVGDMPDLVESSKLERRDSCLSRGSKESGCKRRVQRISESSVDDFPQKEGHRKRSSSVSSSLSNLYCIYEPAAHTNTVNVIPETEESSQSSRDSFAVEDKKDKNKKTLLNPVYVLVCLTYIFVTNSNMAFMTVIMDFAHDRGIPLSKAVYLLSAYALCDVTGRLSIGWVTDKGILGRRTVMAISCLTLGMSFQALPFFYTFEGLLVMCLILGYSVGNTVVLFTVILADTVGLDKLPMAMGLMTFFAGVSGFTRPTLIGYFRDQIGSYDNMLRSLGGGILCIGASWAILWIVHKARSKDFEVEEKKQTKEELPGIYIIR